MVLMAQHGSYGSYMFLLLLVCFTNVISELDRESYGSTTWILVGVKETTLLALAQQRRNAVLGHTRTVFAGVESGTKVASPGLEWQPPAWNSGLTAGMTHVQGRKLYCCICLDFHGRARFLSSVIDELRVNPIGSCSVEDPQRLPFRSPKTSSWRNPKEGPCNQGQRAMANRPWVFKTMWRMRRIWDRDIWVANESKPKGGSSFGH